MTSSPQCGPPERIFVELVDCHIIVTNAIVVVTQTVKAYNHHYGHYINGKNSVYVIR